MKINKGTVKNINRKLIAGLLAVSLTTSLSGCIKKNDPRFLEYTKDKTGNISYSGTMNYFYLSNVKFVVLETNDVRTMYLASLSIIDYGKETEKRIYRNIFGGQVLYDTSNKNLDSKIVEEMNIIDYLTSYNEIRQEYTERELKDILENMKTEYETEKEKMIN